MYMNNTGCIKAASNKGLKLERIILGMETRAF